MKKYICGNKMPTRCNTWFLLQQNLPNLQITFSIFKAPNTKGSNHLYNTLELLMMGIVVPQKCWASNKICNKNHLLHLVGILFPHINDDARSKSHRRNIQLDVEISGLKCSTLKCIYGLFFIYLLFSTDSCLFRFLQRFCLIFSEINVQNT